jgi:pSer/pThr/pTyr-binding forkhead associated (FHA) protein
MKRDTRVKDEVCAMTFHLSSQRIADTKRLVAAPVSAGEGRVDVVVRRQTGVPQVLPLVGSVTIGRGPANHLVIPARGVSWHHAVLQRDGDEVWIRDLGSRNGSRLDGQRVTGTVPFTAGSVLRIGDVELTLVHGDLPPRAGGRTMMVEDVSSGLRYPLRGPTFVIGDDPDADLVLPGADRVVLVEHADGDLWVGRGDEVRPLAAGDVFNVSGVALRVVRADDGWQQTKADVEGDSLPGYAVEAAMDSESGPWARVTDGATGLCHRVSAPNRVALLWFLAEAMQADHEVSPADAGWRSNTSVSTAVWGRARQGHDPRLLKALIHNVRSELRGAGLDPWRLEKRRGALRLRVTSVELHNGG